MKIKVGQYYKTRDGRTIGPALVSTLINYPWVVGMDYYTADGRFSVMSLETPCDLIAEAPIDDKDVRIQELINSIDDLGFYVGDLERERNTLKARVAELEYSNHKWSKQLDEVQENQRATHLRNLIKELHDTALERDELRTQLEAAQAKLAEATRKGEILCVEVGNLTMELNEKHETAQELQEREHVLKTCCRSYQLKIDSLEAKLAYLETENADSIGLIAIQTDEFVKLAEERDTLRGRVLELTTMHAAVHEPFANIIKERNELRERLVTHELNLQLATLEPKAQDQRDLPTVVKPVQGISKIRLYDVTDTLWYLTVFSDGTVKAVLEPINNEGE